MTPIPTQIAIRATYMRGGTSKGVFFATDDLPESARVAGPARDRLMLRVTGSPDPYGKHIDGMGQVRRHPDGAVRRHQPAPLRRRHLHRAGGSIDELSLAMGVGFEAGALRIAGRQQMDAIAGRAAAIG